MSTSGVVGMGTEAVYWKNGFPTALTKNVTSSANSIYIFGNDVYVAGGIAGSDGSLRATYWKNGLAVLGISRGFGLHELYIRNL